ncbi:MAG: hypothetical protein A2161_02385 [Candidatus Schekmanbacteria bacterium RBG_13_48_7]|uniref:Uncharacterized protein n=1 Tax=Candidatus Schekmanbacteria bacterium RBG_13_48_7 TaxID=1817878 RepID=A0A1F7RZH4_9BACT|nr:MAG: hypothetical protein A2161_02385 [Candidatus Schekmanbacteria bacterium RBG_13_48_7]
MRDPVILFFIGIISGVIIGLALSIVFSKILGSFFGSKRERQLAQEVKELKTRLKKKDDLIKKAVKSVEKVNGSENDKSLKINLNAK